MSSKIEFKEVTDYKVYDSQGYKSYSITSNNSDSNEYNYHVFISLETAGIKEEPGLYSLGIDKGFTQPRKIDYIDINHLRLAQEPVYDELARTVSIELDFAPVHEQTKVFSLKYGNPSCNYLIDMQMDLI